MKKYMFCFLLFIVTSLVCVGVGYAVTRERPVKEETSQSAVQETETAAEDHLAVNQEMVEPAVKKQEKYQYYLVSEDGYLLVLYEDKTTICLYTHMPVTDFPEEERAKLMEGIWFPSMLEVFNYLESYTS